MRATRPQPRSAIMERVVPLPGPFVSASSSTPTAVTIGTSNTPGAWTELIATTAADGHWLHATVITTGQSATAMTTLADFSTGAAGDEDNNIIVPSVMVGSSVTQYLHLWLPVFTRKGARVSVRLTTAAATAPSPSVQCHVLAGSPLQPHLRSPSKLVAIGANVAASTGDCQMTTSNTYTQITAATTQPFQGLVVSHGPNDAAVSGTTETFTLGVGASGGEVTLAEEHYTTVGASESFVPRFSFLTLFRHIPTGVRLAAKETNATNNTWTCIPIGIPYS